MATHSSILAWKIPWMEEPIRLQSMGLQRIGHNWATALNSSHTSASLLMSSLVGFLFVSSKKVSFMKAEIVFVSVFLTTDLMVSTACYVTLVISDSETLSLQAPLSMGCSRQEYWSGLPSPPPRDIPNPGIEPESLIPTCTGMQVLAPPGKFSTEHVINMFIKWVERKLFKFSDPNLII